MSFCLAIYIAHNKNLITRIPWKFLLERVRIDITHTNGFREMTNSFRKTDIFSFALLTNVKRKKERQPKNRDSQQNPWTFMHKTEQKIFKR